MSQLLRSKKSPTNWVAPAGHTSWSTAGLGYLTFWLLGKLRCFDGSARPMRFVASVLPICCAIWIGRCIAGAALRTVKELTGSSAAGLVKTLWARASLAKRGRLHDTGDGCSNWVQQGVAVCHSCCMRIPA